jgi:hypothetical protein
MRAPFALLLATAVVAVAPAATAATSHSCAPTNRTDQFLKPDPHGIFGIFKIKVAGVICATADQVTNGFYKVQILRSNAKKTLVTHGFTCVLLRPDEAQQLKASCFKGKTKRIRFVMEIPNG